MEFITSTILSGMLWDGIKDGAVISASMLKSKLKGWLVDDDMIEELISLLKDADVNEDLNEKAIERRISSSTDLCEFMQKVKPDGTSSINIQTNSAGNNVYAGSSAVVTIGDVSTSFGNDCLNNKE